MRAIFIAALRLKAPEPGLDEWIVNEKRGISAARNLRNLTLFLLRPLLNHAPRQANGGASWLGRVILRRRRREISLHLLA